MHAIQLLILSVALPAAPDEPIAVKSVESFEANAALASWVLRDVKGERVADRVTHREHAARLVYPKWRKGMGQWPASVLDFGKGGFDTKDWSRYDVLKFDVFNDTDRAAPLKLRLDDANRKRWTVAFSVPPRTPHTCEIPITRLGIDAKSVVHLDLYMTQPAIDFVYTIDNLRLEAYPLRIEKAELRPDPFRSGKVSVQCQLSRPAQCRVQVTDASSGIVATAAIAGSTVSWQWDAKVSGKPAAPGRYKAALVVTDDVASTASTHVLGEFQILPDDGQPETIAWHEPTTRKVMLHSAPRDDGQIVTWEDVAAQKPGLPPVRIDMARNEYEGAQVVFLTRERQATFRFAIEGLRHADSGAAFPMKRSAIYQVGYVETKDPKIYKASHVGW